MTFPFISSVGSFRQSSARFIGPFSARLGFISCLPRLWWWSQICGLGQPLTSFLYPGLFPSSSSSSLSAFCLTHLASVLPGPACRSRRMSRQKKNAKSTVFLLSRDSRQIACLFYPVVTVCAHPLNIDPQDVPDGHLGWPIRWWKCKILSISSCKSCN